MKSVSLVLFFVICSARITAQAGPFMITCNVKKYPDKSVAYLRYAGLNGPFEDSSTVENGNVVFKGEIDEPRPATIVIRQPGKGPSPQNVLAFYIETGETMITAKSNIKGASISGSQASLDKITLDKITSHAALSPPQTATVVTTTRIVRIPSGSSAPPSISQFPGPGESKTIRTVNTADLPPEAQAAIAARIESSKGEIKDFILAHPKSFVSLYTVCSLWRSRVISAGEYIALTNALDPSLMESNAAKTLFRPK